VVDNAEEHRVAARIAPSQPQRVMQFPLSIISVDPDPGFIAPEDSLALRTVHLADIASAAWAGDASDGVESSGGTKTVLIVACGHFDPAKIVRDARSHAAPSPVSVGSYAGFTTLAWPHAFDTGAPAVSLGVNDHTLVAAASLPLVQGLIRRTGMATSTGVSRLRDLAASANANHEFYVTIATNVNDSTFSDSARQKFTLDPRLSKSKIAGFVREERAGGVLSRFDGVMVGVRDLAGRPRIVFTYDYANDTAARQSADVFKSMMAHSREINGPGTGTPMNKEWHVESVLADGRVLVATLTPLGYQSSPADTMLQPMHILTDETRLTVWDDAP
jgi:hypothetical protein